MFIGETINMGADIAVQSAVQCAVRSAVQHAVQRSVQHNVWHNVNSLISADTAPLLLPSYWYVIMAALSLLLPAGFVLVSAAGLEPRRAWDAA